MQQRARVLGFGLMLPFAAIFIAACGPGGETDAGPADAGPTGCQRNIECGSGSICEKQPGETTGVCQKVFCVADTDCADNEYCAVQKGLCVNENTCDPGNPGDVCQAGEVCTYVDGIPQCTDPAQLPAPTACRVAPSPVLVSAGSTVELEGVGLDANDKLVPFVDFTFAQSGGVGTVTGNQLAATCATGVCEGTITASTTRGTATCTATVKVYAEPAATDTRVVLFDTNTGLPIAGAATTVTVAGAPLASVTTDANGVATFTGVAGATVEAVSAFPSGHQWQTVVSPNTNNVALFTVAIPNEEQVAGVKGHFDFSNVTTQGDIKLGLAGMSIGGAITDLDFATLLGEIANYNIVLEGVTDADGEQVPLPSGLVLELGAEKIKGDFVTLGDEGLRILWALGGKVRLSEIGSIISSVTASDDVNIGQVLSAVLPFFGKFDHAIVSGLDLNNVTRPPSPGEDIPVPYNDWAFPELTGANAVRLNTLLTQAATYTLPTLPCVPGQGTAATSCTGSAHASGAVLLSGVVVPGIGLVPLGLTAGLDDPDDQDTNDQRDGKLDYLNDGSSPATPPAAGTARIDYAPPHDGLEGNLFVTIAIALDINGLTSGSLGASTITHVTDKYSATNSFPGSFLEHQGGSWDITSDDDRTFTLTTVGTADFYRLNLNNGEKEWNIWFPSGTTTISTAALRPSELQKQREFGADIQAFRLGTGYTGLKPADFDALVKFNGTNMNNLLYYMGGWSSQACEDAVDGEATPFCERVGAPAQP